jgi:L-iditol 2-dehydrogenase
MVPTAEPGLVRCVPTVGAAETRDAAVKIARRGGEVVWLGLHDDSTQLSGFEVVLGERKVLGSFAVTHHNLRTAIGLFAHGKITLDPWVRTFPLSDGVRVFRQRIPRRITLKPSSCRR